MSSNRYNYKYSSHQRSSAQQYSSYQTAPATNSSTKTSPQYQQAPSAAPSHSTDYLLYSGPSYGTSGTGYGPVPDGNWNASGSNYGTSRDNGSRAAEILRSMSNTGYVATTTAPSQPESTATNVATAHYPSERSPQVQAQPLHSTYGQTQTRPHSVNTNQIPVSASRGLSSPATAAGHPSQRALHFPLQQTQQLTARSTQNQYNQSNAVAAKETAAMAAAGSSQHYSVYSHRHVPEADTSRTSHTATPSTSYTPRPPASIIQPLVSSMPEPYTGPSTTVDPTAVYDPWPEYQRLKAIRDTERAEREREEEASRREKERLEEEERMQKEAEEEARQAQLATSLPKFRGKMAQKQQTPAPGAIHAEASGASAASDLEAEIRSMMAKMRELNGKDPQLLARIWEEERRAKAPTTKSPTVTTRSGQSATQLSTVPYTQQPTPPLANQRKKATPRGATSALTVKPATATVVSPTTAPPATSMRTGGTIWPPEKKLELAKAAAHYLTTKNPNQPLGPDEILQMLNGNPSYVELCEQLEGMGFKLDRSIFARSLLLAVPDVNSASRKHSGPATVKPPPPPVVMKFPAPPAVMKKPVATPVAPSPRYALTAASSMDSSPYPPFPDNDAMAAPIPIPVAEMIPIKPGLELPANKEEAARKRNLSDLVDLTQLDDEEEMGPPRKKSNGNTYASSYGHAINIDNGLVGNFPTASASALAMDEPIPHTAPVPIPATELRYSTIVEPLDKRKALRRNTYNASTIARDVLLACGRHPSERQLNQHLDILKVNLPQISNESDLSTIKWDFIDPGIPPPGYFKDRVQALTEDAYDKDGSGDEIQGKAARRLSSSHTESARVQALPEATNPFIKQKRRGRPPRSSLPNTTTPSTPNRQTNSAKMSSSAPRAASAGVGYSAFREYGPDGNPLPKKKGRPVGWRKAIHGSAAAQQRPAMNVHVGKYDLQQSSSLRNVRANQDPIQIDSRSPSVANHAPQYQLFKCKWQNCKAELHNLETLKLHVFKVHKKETLRSTLECLWDDCGKEVTSHDPMSNMTLERHVPPAFGGEIAWREHIQQNHFDPLAWEQGDGPAGGLSDAHDSEACLSDAQGQRVTPRITASPADHKNIILSPQLSTSLPRGRGRPTKTTQEQDARDTQNRLVSRKRRMGGPGMDRGGATLVNDKRRRGLIESDGTEEEYVDAGD